MKFIEKPEWKKLVSFVPNKKEPVHNWFYYKEGYSKELVFKLIEKFELKGKCLDPFCGSGTTLLACKQKGLEAIGFDVAPLPILVSNVKCAEYNVKELKKTMNDFFEEKTEKMDYKTSALTKKAFKKEDLNDIFYYKEKIKTLPRHLQDFFLVGLIHTSTISTYAEKDGAHIKIVKKHVPPVKKMYYRTIKKMIKEYSKLEAPGNAKAFMGDARQMNLPDESIDFVITSPPYLNKIEYTQVYSIERELFFDSLKHTQLRSFLGTDVKDLDENLPPIAKAYFSDMEKVVKELSRVCKKNAWAFINVANGCLDGLIVNSDEIIAGIAEENGFECKEILVVSRRWCTRNRTEKTGQTRESIIILKKEK